MAFRSKLFTINSVSDSIISFIYFLDTFPWLRWSIALKTSTTCNSFSNCLFLFLNCLIFFWTKCIISISFSNSLANEHIMSNSHFYCSSVLFIFLSVFLENLLFDLGRIADKKLMRLNIKLLLVVDTSRVGSVYDFNKERTIIISYLNIHFRGWNMFFKEAEEVSLINNDSLYISSCIFSTWFKYLEK